MKEDHLSAHGQNAEVNVESLEELAGPGTGSEAVATGLEGAGGGADAGEFAVGQFAVGQGEAVYSCVGGQFDSGSATGCCEGL